MVYYETVFSDEELFHMVAERLGDLDSLELADQEAEDKVYKGLKAVDGITELLRDTMVKDLRRYFAAATEEERRTIKGGFARTAHWLSKIVKQD